MSIMTMIKNNMMGKNELPESVERDEVKKNSLTKQNISVHSLCDSNTRKKAATAATAEWMK